MKTISDMDRANLVNGVATHTTTSIILDRNGLCNAGRSRGGLESAAKAARGSLDLQLEDMTFDRDKTYPQTLLQ